MKIDFDEEIKAIKKQLTKQYIIVGILSGLIVLDIVLTLLFQNRETQGFYIIFSTVFIWILITMMWFVIFSFINPERKWLSVIFKAQKEGTHEVTCLIAEHLSKSFEDGFFVQRYQTKSEAGNLIVKVEDSEAFVLEVGKQYTLNICSRYVLGVEEIKDEN